MGRKKKPAGELTTDEALRRLFPAKVVKEAKKVAHERDEAGEKKANKQGKSK